MLNSQRIRGLLDSGIVFVRCLLESGLECFVEMMKRCRRGLLLSQG